MADVAATSSASSTTDIQGTDTGCYTSAKSTLKTSVRVAMSLGRVVTWTSITVLHKTPGVDEAMLTKLHC